MAQLTLLLSPWAVAVGIPLWLALYYILPYLTTYRHLSKVPGPPSAKFSNIWIGLSARSGQKYAAIDWAHRKYGKVVRIGFNHVSIADERGLNVVYGHGNGFLKDQYYEAFVARTPGMFNVRDRAEHTRKRKIISHAFSPRAVAAFEPHMAANLQRWVKQLDRIATSGLQSEKNNSQYARYNAMPWFSYLAFDIIGDLAFGAPFGMVEKGKDETEVQFTQGGPISYCPAVEVLNRRGEVSSTLGLLPTLRPIARYLPDPFFMKGVAAVENLTGIAVAAVASRLDAAEKGIVDTRNDILSRLLQAKDANGQPMGRTELTAEALTQLIAGSDTISNTACAVFYWILHGERSAPGTIVPRLQEELDKAIGSGLDIASYSQVRDLPFLRRCIDEGMRLHSTSAIGLPRIVADNGGGVKFDEYYFPPGTVLSVPSYTIHHMQEIWGDDVEEFKPDRWLNLTARQKMGFNPFSYGPRACVGQNVAIMELQLIIGTLFHRYTFTLYQPFMESHEGFSKKPKECYAGICMRL
ncbi:Cytochrome P450 [Penicillium argentinense]|uniref:Cytochrome P450 n=1 Tax=Penicillium argentinense TaxID=1131581 RepID=A0A9W9EY24_9EURO|nr:Cytochrome P450 [Penicillium argentinense]KAJ5090082.1 Cytochrome P450 [Penicillium argentinense]